jgi:hypothetical protein
MVNPAFKQGLREGLTGGCVADFLNRKRRGDGLTKWKYSGPHESFGVPAPDDESRPPISIEQLNVYAVERWEVSGEDLSSRGSLCLRSFCDMTNGLPLHSDDTSFHGYLRG